MDLAPYIRNKKKGTITFDTGFNSTVTSSLGVGPSEFGDVRIIEDSIIHFV
jgi:hypothetical protein